MKTYIPEFKVGDIVWFEAFPNKIHISSVKYITLYRNGNFKYHLHGFMDEFEGKELNVGWPVM